MLVFVYLAMIRKVKKNVNKTSKLTLQFHFVKVKKIDKEQQYKLEIC